MFTIKMCTQGLKLDFQEGDCQAELLNVFETAPLQSFFVDKGAAQLLCGRMWHATDEPSTNGTDVTHALGRSSGFMKINKKGSCRPEWSRRWSVEKWMDLARKHQGANKPTVETSEPFLFLCV